MCLNVHRVALAATMVLGCLPAFAASANLTVCAEKIAGDPDDFEDEFSHGPITVPAGVVFDFAGHSFGPASDPKDASHYAKDGLGWTGITTAEDKRRTAAIMEDASADQLHKSGLITVGSVRLTKAQPCATVNVAALDSETWGWTVRPVFGQPGFYFQVYGILVNGVLQTAFEDDDNPLEHAAARGEINGTLSGTTDRVIRIR